MIHTTQRYAADPVGMICAVGMICVIAMIYEVFVNICPSFQPRSAQARAVVTRPRKEEEIPVVFLIEIFFCSEKSFFLSSFSRTQDCSFSRLNVSHLVVLKSGVSSRGFVSILSLKKQVFWNSVSFVFLKVKKKMEFRLDREDSDTQVNKFSSTCSLDFVFYFIPNQNLKVFNYFFSFQNIDFSAKSFLKQTKTI